MSRLRGFFIGAGLLLTVFALTACDNSSPSTTNETPSTNETTNTQNTNTDSSTNETTASPTPEAMPETTVTETATSTTSQTPDKVNLTHHLQPGQSFRMQMTQSQTLEQSMFGQSVKSDSTSVTVMRYVVDSVDADGNITMTVSYESMKSREEGPNGINEFDSTQMDAASNNPQEAILVAMMGQNLEIFMSAKGEVLRVDGFAQMMDAMLATQDPAAVELAKPMIESAFGEDAFKDVMQNVVMAYPDKLVGVGDLWQNSILVSAGIPMQMDTSWTVTSLENGVLSADIAQAIQANPDAEPLSLGPISLSYPTLVGQGTGELKIDTQTGWMVSNRTTHEFSGEMVMEGLDQLGETPPIPITATFETLIELLE